MGAVLGSFIAEAATCVTASLGEAADASALGTDRSAGSAGAGGAEAVVAAVVVELGAFVDPVSFGAGFAAIRVSSKLSRPDEASGETFAGVLGEADADSGIGGAADDFVVEGSKAGPLGLGGGVGKELPEDSD